MKIEFEFFVIFCTVLIFPLLSANQELPIRHAIQDTLQNPLPDIRLQHFINLDQKTKHEVDSMLKRLPLLKDKRKVRKLKKIKKILVELTKKETGIPDTILITPAIRADTVEVIPVIKKEDKKPLLKRIFKQRKKKRNE